MFYKYIEFKNRLSGKMEKHPVLNVFWLACISPVDFPEMEKCGAVGINIGIAIPHKNQKEADKFYAKLFGPKKIDDKVVFFLLGKNKIKIPVQFQDGNSYEQKMGTSCIFAYIIPSVVAPDERPPHPCTFTNKLGSEILNLKYPLKK